MAIPKEYFQFPDDVKLYHYTSHEGIISVRNSKQLWLSNIKFQNDSKEYDYAVDLANEIFKKYNRFAPINYGLPPVYTFSLSSEGDLLSQWRGYCTAGGISLSFNSEQLLKILEANNMSIGRCLYQENEQIELITKAIGYSPESWDYRLRNQTRYEQKYSVRTAEMYEIVHDVYRCLPLIKHPAFSEENEYRLIFFSNDNTQVNFKASKSGITPFVKIPIHKTDNENELIDIDEIIISPNPNPELAVSGYNIMVGKNIAKVSKIPYRNW